MLKPFMKPCTQTKSKTTYTATVPSRLYMGDTGAIPLVTVQDGRYAVSEGAVALLQQIEEPVAVVAVAGPYRSAAWMGSVLRGQ